MYARRLSDAAVLGSLLLGVLTVACGDDVGSDGKAQRGTSSTSSSTTSSPTTPSTTEPPTVSTTTPSTASTTTTTTAPSPPPSPPPPSPVLRPGDRSPAVEQLQRRLRDLRYWVGPADGAYGTLTEQAVYAFQKVNGLTVDGIAGSEVQSALEQPAPPAPRSTAGLVWEVDKTRQVLMVVRDGDPLWIWNTSTGTEEPYTHEGRQLLADTPTGHFAVSWQVDGWRDGALGRMWRPKYFHPDGIAIHGYGSVPPTPASHGCVRVTIAAMNHIWEEGLAPVGAEVWVYGTSPT